MSSGWYPSIGSLPDETGTGQTHVGASVGCPDTDCLGGGRHGLVARNMDLRTWLEDCGYPYGLAVACNEAVGILTPDGVRRRVEAAQVETFLLQAQDWQRLSMSEGSKGPRLFDWAYVPILHRWEDDECRWVLIRRSLTDPNEKAYSFVFAPKGTTLPEMVAAIGARWQIEENLENAKDLGLDHYEVRSFTGRYRHITLVLVALAYLTGICATERFSPSPPAPSPLPARPVVLAPPRPRSAPSACTAHLALFFICLSGSGMPRGGDAAIKVMPAITTPNVVVISWLILASSPFFANVCCPSFFLRHFQEISWKCRSSGKSPATVVSLVCRFVSSRKETRS